MKKKKTSFHMREVANQIRTDEGRGRACHPNRPNNSERWNFCFSLQLSVFSGLSLSFPPPGGRQVVTFSLPPTSCLASENAAAVGWEDKGVLQRGAQKTQIPSFSSPWS